MIQRGLWLAIYFGVLIWSGIAPKHGLTWLLEWGVALPTWRFSPPKAPPGIHIPISALRYWVRCSRCCCYANGMTGNWPD